MNIRLVGMLPIVLEDAHITLLWFFVRIIPALAELITVINRTGIAILLYFPKGAFDLHSYLDFIE